MRSVWGAWSDNSLCMISYFGFWVKKSSSIFHTFHLYWPSIYNSCIQWDNVSKVLYKTICVQCLFLHFECISTRMFPGTYLIKICQHTHIFLSFHFDVVLEVEFGSTTTNRISLKVCKVCPWIHHSMTSFHMIGSIYYLHHLPWFYFYTCSPALKPC